MPCSVLSCAVVVRTDPDDRYAELRLALPERAERLQRFPDGKFSPSPKPALLDKLTDAHLVVASEVVADVSDCYKISGRLRQRLLAWVVADVRGADLVMEKELAFTVGKRLERQAEKVDTDYYVAQQRAGSAAHYLRGLLRQPARSGFVCRAVSRRGRARQGRRYSHDHGGGAGGAAQGSYMSVSTSWTASSKSRPPPRLRLLLASYGARACSRWPTYPR
jgi:hypothetical protein